MEQTKISQYMINKSNHINKSDYRFKFKRILFLVLAALFISFFLYSFKAHASEFQLIVPDKVVLKDSSVKYQLIITNLEDSTNLYEFKLYSSPFSGTINPSSIRIDARQTKQVELIIYPIENSTNQEYISTISVLVNSQIHFYTFIIVQQTNKICPIDINYKTDYLIDSNRFHLDINLTNNTTKYQTLIIKEIKPINTTIQEMSVNLYALENKHSTFYFDTNETEVKLIYVCNSNFEELSINLPTKPIIINLEPKENQIWNNISGYFTISKFKEISNSLAFQVILIIIIVLLVLSFTSRYIKLLQLTSYKRK